MILLKINGIIKVQKKQKPYFKKRIGVFIMANKVTKKDNFNTLLYIVNGADISEEQKITLTAFISHEIELIENKSNSTKPSKKQEENASVKTIILAELSKADEPLTITEMQKISEPLANFTCQKISALLRQLIEENKVAKEIIKKKSYFSIV